ncbi:hypothetical protein B808_1053 [Fructilactobacillus florum 8D]|uniref:Uncharacterized protein n=1 Tax=Fructilactobacillus florum 8D TaxID=1221538 RepID=W9ED99_9LACO|nr:hypothetical protein [Fructilactobacillus florum]EKK20638.1 hypothetical protein B807_608 [Fructilactobacillus florum 2F]ETO40047.1 hypothetical protein B808_1053 [Fructilactobacillus florum 8D]
MFVPNLLQFVPNEYIANNYLKTNFYLKDILCYRKVEEKITGTMSSNLKFDDSEGKTKNWSLLRNCYFISCFTMLSTNDFKDGILDIDFAEKLKKGNVDNDGNSVERPFITISSENTPKLLNNLSNQVNDYLKDKNLKGSGLFSRAVRYLDEDDYKKEELYEENNITNINGIFIKNDTKMISRSSSSDSLLKNILQFLYIFKPIYFKDQHEYRLGLALDAPIDVNELFIPVHDLRKYVKVHSFQDINNLKLEDI